MTCHTFAGSSLFSEHVGGGRSLGCTWLEKVKMTTSPRREIWTQLRLWSPEYTSPPTTSMLQPVAYGLHITSGGWALSQKQWPIASQWGWNWPWPPLNRISGKHHAPISYLRKPALGPDSSHAHRARGPYRLGSLGRNAFAPEVSGVRIEPTRLEALAPIHQATALVMSQGLIA